MRFRPNGPDIPGELVAVQEKGQTIFVCGAGVSRTVGLPLFRGLVERVYQSLGEDWNLHIAEREGMREHGELGGQYDRVLRSLERRLAASDAPRNRGMRERIRTAVRNVLAPPENPDLTNHLALLELSRDAEGRVRLLTTNFDTLFERAWFERHRTPIASHAGTAMPQPKVAGCTGVLHLHGRLADSQRELNETDLVLTSAEFGDAYLRSGWASRYVYDLVRAYTVVLVGYQADDPPMRYLLEVLEADRERYPDLQKVYAFASCDPGKEELVRALWRAKAVEPILYTTNGDDHSLLYDSVREWRRYAEDPTAWRREQLRALLNESPGSQDDAKIQECVALLGHGDASQLLGELSPKADWLPILVEKHVFDREGSRPGQWIATRISDPDMIRACAGLASFDDQSRWHINRAVERERPKLTPVRLKAWQLMLSAKRPRPAIDLDDSWYLVAANIKKGEAGFEARHLVARILCPRLDVEKAIRWGLEEKAVEEPEAIHNLLRLDFVSARHPPPEEILSAWPQSADREIALFRTLDRALMGALEEAEEVGFMDGLDRISYDVPSVAPHAQNAYHTGFYPITRALADLWQRIVAGDRSHARTLGLAWEDSHFLLIKRLWLFTLTNDAFTPQEAAAAVLKLDNHVFWISWAQVEIMRILAGRWMQFDPADRSAIEARIRQGIVRDLFPPDAFENEGEWSSIRDSSSFRRLKRIEAAGGILAPDSHTLLTEIFARHPKWQPGADDRDDFHSWMGEIRSGPDGHPELLANIADERLVKEAMRLQQERHFEEGDLWRLFCAADPDRALRGLRLEADGGQWGTDAWRCLLWAANDKGDPGFQFELADLLLQMPDGPLNENLSSATSWLQRRREALSAIDRPGGPRFLRLWDRFAELAYGVQQQGDPAASDDADIQFETLNRPGGILAWSLLDALGASKPESGSGLSADLKLRFDKVVAAPGRPGLIARAHLCHFLAYIDSIDPVWTEEKLRPLFLWEHPEALAMWRSFFQGRVGSARLFNVLKPAMLEAFERNDLSDHELEGLVAQLLSVGISHQRGEATEYNLTHAEIKRALTVGPPAARRNASWNFWLMMGNQERDPADKATRWRQIVGPLLRDIWPLDGELRSEQTTRNLVMMALECEAAFPEAVQAIIDFVVPYQLYQISHSLRLENKHDHLIREHPVAFLRLANALIDPAVYRVPSDLATLLQECLNADPVAANDPAYVRLYGLRRQVNA